MAGRYHLAGIGGTGMSALAQALLDGGHAVSGSDRLLDRGGETDTLRRLREQGAAFFPQDGGGARGAARLVVSTAVEADNPEVLAAAAGGVPVVHRANQLAELVAGRRLIAVAGTCGKSTVAAMTGWLLQEAGFDPLVVNGAESPAWQGGGRVGSVRKGGGEWAVVEVDESDKSLTVFKPELAVVTNASADHFGLDETLSLFDAFRANVTGGLIDGTTGGAGPEGVVCGGWDGAFSYRGVRFPVPMPGRYNVVNAWHAVRLATMAGAGLEGAAEALGRFPGVARRMQRHGRCGGAVVVDDFAHNPEKIAAAWQGVRLATGGGAVAGLWRPHGYAPLRKMMAGLVEAFAGVAGVGDRLLLLPVYDAGGTADRSVDSGMLAEALAARGVRCGCVGTLEEAEAALRAAAGEEGVAALFVFGARDPGLPGLAARLGGGG